MPGDHERAGVDAVARDGGGLLKELQRGEGVFGRVAEGEGARTAPGAAVMERQDIPAGAPRRLRKIQILLIAGKAMEQQQRGMEQLQN